MGGIGGFDLSLIALLLIVQGRGQTIAMLLIALSLLSGALRLMLREHGKIVRATLRLLALERT